MTTDDKLQEIAQLLTDGEYDEAMKELRAMHGLVNRFVCCLCGKISPDAAAVMCPVCNGYVEIRVVVEKPKAEGGL